MIERSATVVARSAGRVTVQAERESTCGGCVAAHAGCGSATLARVLGRRSVRLEMPEALPVEIGERVVVGLAEGAMLRGAAWIYGLPLLVMLAAGLVAQAVGSVAGQPSELPVIVVALAGLAAGLYIARLRLSSRRCRISSVRLLRREPASI